MQDELFEAIEEMGGIVLRCCLAQSGNPVAFSAIGGGRLILDFDDTMNETATELVKWKEVALFCLLLPDPDGKLIQRRGRPKKKGM